MYIILYIHTIHILPSPISTISHHYGKHIILITPSIPQHNGHNPRRKMGRADAEEVMMFLFFKSKAGF